MPLAINVHEPLFAAIEKRFAADGDLLEICKRLWIDFVPEKDEEGNEIAYPAVVVKQGEEGGHSEPGPGGRPVYESFVINFDVFGSTRAEVGQIAWQLAKLFGGDDDNDCWSGDYDGVRIIGTERSSPPVVVQVEQGVCEGTVGFVVMASPLGSTV